MRERDVQNAILEWLSYKKIFHERINSGMIFANKYAVKGATPGFPDILVLFKSRFIGLEVKTDKGKQNENQKNMESEIKKHGGEYYIVRSIDDVEKIFNCG